MKQITRANLRHLSLFLRYGNNPAATVYDSIGPDFFLAPAPGWLNLGSWTGDGTRESGEEAVRRLVTEIATPLPVGGVVLDVANGLGAQDEIIADVARPSRLIAVNITESQLRAGRERLRRAGAFPVNADATRLPVADASVDGLISVEAAFHFPSRAGFFAEAFRALRPGGVLTMSDVGVERSVRTPAEALAGLVNLRVWGLKARNMISTETIADLASQAGFVDVGAERVTERVIVPAIRFLRAKLNAVPDAPLLYRTGARVILRQWELVTRRGIIEYVLLTARKPSAAT